MNVVKSILLAVLLTLTASAYALNQQIQVDLLMNKITNSIKSDKPGDALPYFAELEAMAPSLSKPLPESFYYYYIVALDKTGDAKGALARGDSFLDTFGKKAKNYNEVLDIVSRLQIQADKQRQQEAKEEAEYQQKLSVYEEKVRQCINNGEWEREVARLKEITRQSYDEMNYNQTENTINRYKRASKRSSDVEWMGSHKYCENEYSNYKPTKNSK